MAMNKMDFKEIIDFCKKQDTKYELIGGVASVVAMICLYRAGIAKGLGEVAKLSMKNAPEE